MRVSETAMRSQRSQTPQSTQLLIPFVWNPRRGETVRSDRQWVRGCWGQKEH